MVFAKQLLVNFSKNIFMATFQKYSKPTSGPFSKNIPWQIPVHFLKNIPRQLLGHLHFRRICSISGPNSVHFLKNILRQLPFSTNFIKQTAGSFSIKYYQGIFQCIFNYFSFMKESSTISKCTQVHHSTHHKRLSTLDVF